MKTPFVTAEELTRITQDYPTPFHLYDEKGIRAAARRLNEAFAWNPGFREYFAVKALPNPYILSILKEEGCGVDCSSLTELLLAKACGFHDEDIMFSSNETPPEEYRMAAELQGIINLDDFTHIAYLNKLTGIPETICCRYNPGGNFGDGNDIMGTPADAKYGFTYPQLVEGFQELKRLGARHFGIHAFLASNMLDPDYYPRLARTLFETVVRLRDDTGVDISFVNLSGGIGIPYRPEDALPDILRVGEAVREAYETVLTPAGLGRISLYTELGRYMTGPHGCLVTRAVHEKHIYKEYIGVDACSADLMRPAMYGAYHHITVAGKENAPATHTYDVVGALCENNDKFAIDRKLPQIERGDLLIIHDTGAHGFSMGYNYNGRLRHAELLLREDRSPQMIRRAETTRDYFATLDFSEYVLTEE